ncbi:uncharacterized protein LOC121875701 isoform X2 [Homarus americanus]|uniref:uncharacterized protein LOC121875701 isoform X2 n=1 Tax=Homarus americanus TaxID=6706 RepID=UPI001C455927|nr:uncharacterized protein LOC121875701 isoform X2 [Homarus americanus]
MFWSRKRLHKSINESHQPGNEDKSSQAVENPTKPHLAAGTSLLEIYGDVHTQKCSPQDQNVDSSENLNCRILETSRNSEDKSKTECVTTSLDKLDSSAVDDFPSEYPNYNASSDSKANKNVEVAEENNYEYFLLHCCMCSKYFINEADFLRHRYSCVILKKCAVCSMTFNTHGHLLLHVKREKHEFNFMKWKMVSYTMLLQLREEGKVTLIDLKDDHMMKRIKRRELKGQKNLDKDYKVPGSCSDNKQILNVVDNCSQSDIVRSLLKECVSKLRDSVTEKNRKNIAASSEYFDGKFHDLPVSNSETVSDSKSVQISGKMMLSAPNSVEVLSEKLCFGLGSSVEKNHSSEEALHKTSNDADELETNKVGLVNITLCNGCKLYFLYKTSFKKHVVKCKRKMKHFESSLGLRTRVIDSKHTITQGSQLFTSSRKLKHLIDRGRVAQNDVKRYKWYTLKKEKELFVALEGKDKKLSTSLKNKSLMSRSSLTEIKCNVVVPSEVFTQKHIDACNSLRDMIVIDQYRSPSLLNNHSGHKDLLVPKAKPVQEEVTVNKPLQEEVTVSKPVQKENIVNEPVQENVTVSKLVQNENMVSKPVQKEVPPRAPIQNKVKVNQPEEKEVPSSKPVQQKVTNNEPVQEKVIASKPVQEKLAAVNSKPVQENVATVNSKPVQEKIAAVNSKPVQEKVIASKPVQEKVITSKPVQEKVATVSSKPVQEKVATVSSKPVQEKVMTSKPVQEKVATVNSKPVQEKLAVVNNKPVPEKVNASKPVQEKVITSKPVQEKVNTSKTVQEKVATVNSKPVEEKDALMTNNTVDGSSLEKKGCQKLTANMTLYYSGGEMSHEHKQNVKSETCEGKVYKKNPEKMITQNSAISLEGPIRYQTDDMHHDIQSVNVCNGSDKAVKVSETLENVNKEISQNKAGIKRKESYDNPMPKLRKVALEHENVEKCCQGSLHTRRSVRLESVTNYCPGCSEFIDINTGIFNTKTYVFSFWCKKCAWEIIFY